MRETVLYKLGALQATYDQEKACALREHWDTVITLLSPKVKFLQGIISYFLKICNIIKSKIEFPLPRDYWKVHC